MQQGTKHSAETRAKISLAGKGRICSPETRAKMSKARKGRVFSPTHRANHTAAMRLLATNLDWRAKISATLMGHPVSPEAREKMRAANIGRVHTPEYRAKMSAAIRASEACKRAAADPLRNAKLSASKMGHPVSSETRAKLSRILKANPVKVRPPQKNTKPERAVQAWLRDHFMTFATHYRVPGIKHQFDIALPRRKILIEVDGCYFHGCPAHHPASPYRGRAVTRAANFKRIVKRRGWQLFRIWEHDTKQPLQLTAALNRIVGRQ